MSFAGVVPKELVGDGRLVFTFEFPGENKRASIGLYQFVAAPLNQ